MVGRYEDWEDSFDEDEGWEISFDENEDWENSFDENEDWSDSFDDNDSGYWENYCGGPDDDEHDRYYESIAKIYEEEYDELPEIYEKSESKAHPPGHCPAPNLPAPQMSYLEGRKTAGSPTTYEYFSRVNEKLPEYLDDLLFKTMDASYSPEPLNSQINLNSDETMLKKYLGTYFPRSYMEFMKITSNLFSHPVVDPIIRSKRKLRILDFGSGTGGSLLGTLEALLKMKNLSTEIQISTVDGNPESLKIQDKILSCFYEQKKISRIRHQIIHKQFPIDQTSFEKDIIDFFEKLNSRFDIIISSKLFCEFYNSDYMNALGSFEKFAHAASKYLSKNGFMIINDLTSKDNRVQWMPIIMNRELNRFIRNSCYDYILPISCSHWATNCEAANECYTQTIIKVSHTRKKNDIAKISFKVIAYEDLAAKIISYFPLNQAYRINTKKKALACVQGRRMEIPANNINIQSAFFFNYT